MRCLALFALLMIVAPIHAQQQWGSLSGRVTLEGNIPAAVDLTPLIKKSIDANVCLAGPANQKVSQTWVVDPKTKGVANVFVFLKATPGKAFPIDPADKVRKKAAVVDQPFCAFVPHVIAHYPSYFDGDKQVPTGEKFIVKNSAPVAHNVKGSPSVKSGTPGFNFLVEPGGKREIPLKPYHRPFPIECNAHGWMNAHIFVFDHPYFAITKEDGSFTMPRVPAGLEVTVQAWHEAEGWAVGDDGRAMQLKAGANEFNFSLKAK